MSYEPLQLLTAADLAWPLTYRYHISGPFGGSQFELSVNAPSLYENMDASKRLAPLLWVIGVAPATTTATQCDFVEMVAHRASIIPSVFAPQGLSGTRLSAGSGRAHAAVLGFHSGHHDGLALKRWYAAGMPTSWQSGGMLTREGAERMQELGRGWIAGCGVDAGATDPQLLIRAPRSIPGSLPGSFVDGFRFVRHVRVMQYTAPVPEPGNLAWP